MTSVRTNFHSVRTNHRPEAYDFRSFRVDRNNRWFKVCSDSQTPSHCSTANESFVFVCQMAAIGTIITGMNFYSPATYSTNVFFLLTAFIIQYVCLWLVVEKSVDCCTDNGVTHLNVKRQKPLIFHNFFVHHWKMQTGDACNCINFIISNKL